MKNKKSESDNISPQNVFLMGLANSSSLYSFTPKKSFKDIDLLLDYRFQNKLFIKEIMKLYLNSNSLIGENGFQHFQNIGDFQNPTSIGTINYLFATNSFSFEYQRLIKN